MYDDALALLNELKNGKQMTAEEISELGFNFDAETLDQIVSGNMSSIDYAIKRFETERNSAQTELYNA